MDVVHIAAVVVESPAPRGASPGGHRGGCTSFCMCVRATQHCGFRTGKAPRATSGSVRLAKNAKTKNDIRAPMDMVVVHMFFSVFCMAIPGRVLSSLPFLPTGRPPRGNRDFPLSAS